MTRTAGLLMDVIDDQGAGMTSSTVSGGGKICRRMPDMTASLVGMTIETTDVLAASQNDILN